MTAVVIAGIIMSGGTLLIPILVGAGLGASFNLAGQGVSNLIDGRGFFDNIKWDSVVLAGLAGAAFATGIGGLVGATAIGAASNAGISALEGENLSNIVFSAVVGGVSAFIGFKAGKYISNKLININTNLSFGEYINMARVDGASFLTRNVAALLSKLYTMGPTITTGVARGITKYIGNWIGDWIW